MKKQKLFSRLAALALAALLGISCLGCQGQTPSATQGASSEETTASGTGSQETKAPSQETEAPSADENTAAMTDGVYTASARGFGLTAPMSVTVTVADGKMTAIEVGENSDTASVCGSAIELLIPRILETQSLAVDTVTGATASSVAIRTAVADCIEKAGGNSSDFYVDIPKSTDSESYDVDVAVVGFGGSGAAAALAAAENGASVMVLEKAGKIGGTSAVTGGMMSVNPPSQVNAELKGWTDAATGETYDKPAGQLLTDADGLYQEWISYTTVDGVQGAKEDLIRLTIDRSGETMDWLTENGFQFDNAIGFLGGKWTIYTVYTGNKDLTQGFFETFLENYTGLGGQYLLETEGTELIFTDGKVSGVKAVKNDGTEVTVNAKKVILACGGFAGSDELMEEYLGEAWKVYGMMQNDGAGIRMALSAGASTYNIDMPPMSHFSAPQTVINKFDTAFDNDILYGMVNCSETLAVNKDGQRFVNEQNIGYGAYVGGARFYSIYSSDMIDVMREQGFGKDATGRYLNHTGVGGGIPADMPMTNIDAVLETSLEAGTVYKADSLEALAQAIAKENPRMTEEAFLASVAAYNEGCASGEDAMGKNPECFERLGSIEDGCEYYIAVVGAPYIYSTCGGIEVDESMHVLDAEGNPIENLYSVGTDSMGVLFTNGKGYANFGGVAQGWCYVSGRIAGEDAAESVK